jgi:hypothetical protein
VVCCGVHAAGICLAGLAASCKGPQGSRPWLGQGLGSVCGLSAAPGSWRVSCGVLHASYAVAVPAGVPCWCRPRGLVAAWPAHDVAALVAAWPATNVIQVGMSWCQQAWMLPVSGRTCSALGALADKSDGLKGVVTVLFVLAAMPITACRLRPLCCFTSEVSTKWYCCTTRWCCASSASAVWHAGLLWHADKHHNMCAARVLFMLIS